MVDECVIDTNVFVQAFNPGDEVFHAGASRFIEAFLATDAHICVDPGVDLPADRAISRIWVEYREQGLLTPECDAYLALEALMKADRIRELPPRSIRGRDLMRCVTDRKDHVFMRVAAAAADQLLVTNDGGFTAQCSARTLRRDYGVTVEAPDDAETRFAA